MNSSALKLVVHAVLDQVAEPAVRDQRADGGSATVETVATRRPAMITGSASGSSTRKSSRAGAVPEPERGLDGPRPARSEALEDRADQDRQRVERQPDHHRGLRQPGERHQQREQRQRRDRVDAV